MVDLIEGFRFSQSILQDFVDCRRRFRLRYIDRRVWPAVESEPFMENERLLALGQRFHQMVYQHFMGVPEENLKALIKERELDDWWENYIGFSRQMRQVGMWADSDKLAEYPLSVPISDYRLVAKYDLVSIASDGLVQIYDWKTSQHRPKREWLQNRMQTIVYPFLLVQAYKSIGGAAEIQMEVVELIYWFSNFPNQPEVFKYSDHKYRQDMDTIHDMIELIARLEYDNFHKTTNLDRCRFCEYRSLCNRGEKAGIGEGFDLEDVELMLEFEHNLEQIGEIEY